jgi:hypothetical protein
LPKKLRFRNPFGQRKRRGIPVGKGMASENGKVFVFPGIDEAIFHISQRKKVGQITKKPVWFPQNPLPTP